MDTSYCSHFLMISEICEGLWGGLYLEGNKGAQNVLVEN